MIRCLRPTHFFITLSCNDLWWPSMRKTLQIADRRSDTNPQTLNIQETQQIYEKYPVVVSRQFCYD